MSGPENGNNSEPTLPDRSGSDGHPVPDAPTLPYLGHASGAAAEPPARMFGGHELLKEIGRGGMGVVFKARQIELNRIVALKMILSGTLSRPDEVQRFRVEAEAMARLQHPNIVQVFEVGAVEGRAYYSMEYVEGPSLAQRLEAGPLPSREAARLLAIIARAIHHAHRNGILHRDIKPANILLRSAESGESRVENQQESGAPAPAKNNVPPLESPLSTLCPKVTDFGLAKKLDAGQGRTQTGAIMGTPNYMAPEQAAGRIRDLGPRSDVYSLGAVLYELLTGRPPFEAETALDTLLQVLERQPAPPRLLNATVDRDLESICLKCLEKDPKHRYDSAEHLADELDRYLRGEAITARSFNVFDRIHRTLERDHYLAEFHAWGTMLMIFAGIVLVEHLTIFALTYGGPPYPKRWILAARTAQFSLLGLVFWWHRRHSLQPTSLAERQLWGIWIGYLIACTIVGAIHMQGVRAGHEMDELMMYPFWSALTGMAFFVMGSNYWGRFYTLGMVFFILAALLPLKLEWAVLAYGSLWTLVLTLIGRHLHQLSKAKKKTP